MQNIIDRDEREHRSISNYDKIPDPNEIARAEGEGMTLIEDLPEPKLEREVKQVILIRRDLGMRRGKEIAQGAHASIAFLTNAVAALSISIVGNLSEAAWIWINGAFTKVCLQVHSEEELVDTYNKAKEAGLTAHIITDSGRTEFNGVPTKTTVAIGPDWSDEIDKVTGHLKLY